MSTVPDQVRGRLPDHATFARHVGDTFRLRADGDRTLDLVLTEASTGRRTEVRPDAPDRPFSLVFVSRGPADLPQRTYRLEHPVLGTLEIFLVPLGPEGGGMRYEAVFN